MKWKCCRSTLYRKKTQANETIFLGAGSQLFCAFYNEMNKCRHRLRSSTWSYKKPQKLETTITHACVESASWKGPWKALFHQDVYWNLYCQTKKEASSVSCLDMYTRTYCVLCGWGTNSIRNCSGSLRQRQGGLDKPRHTTLPRKEWMGTNFSQKTSR